jgi:hypothetical protein
LLHGSIGTPVDDWRCSLGFPGRDFNRSSSILRSAAGTVKRTIERSFLIFGRALSSASGEASTPREQNSIFDIGGIFSQNPETTSECSNRVPEAQQGKWCSPDRWCGRVHCCPATVNGDEIRENPLPVRWEGAESRTIRKPGDLPGTACEPIEGEVPGGSAPSRGESRESVVDRMDGRADSPRWVGFLFGRAAHPRHARRSASGTGSGYLDTKRWSVLELLTAFSGGLYSGFYPCA